MSVVFPDLEAMFRNRGIQQRADGSFAEDSWDFGVWWRDASGGVYRLTWIGPRMRADPALAGELYLVRLSGPHVSEIDLRDEDEQLTRARVVSAGAALGAVELLCVIPPSPPIVEENVDAILTGWADVCGAPNSVAWIHGRVWEVLRAGWATPATIRRGASHVA